VGRRGQQCRCCAQGCSKCDTTPTLLKARIVYPEPQDGNEIIAADDNEEPEWTSVTTTCSAPAAEIVVASIFMTDPGEDYTEAPVLSLVGAGGSMSSHAVTVESLIETINVLTGGKGYSSAPAVNFVGGTLVESGSAISTVEGSITSVAVNKVGSAYTEPPAVTFATGSGASAAAVMSGYIASLQITNPGTDYSSVPSVSFSGGGGNGAAATAEISISSGSVIGLAIKTKGSDYTSPPAVTITGGGGQGATATASILYTVKSISVSAGGSGYPPNPGVTLTGGGGAGASATATISGSVVGITVTSPPKYRNRITRPVSNPFDFDWPTISLTSGGGTGATASPVFAGEVISVTVVASGYATPPTVEFSGGGGTGAAAIAELSWQRDHYRRAFVSPTTCSASLFHSTCLDAAATQLPPNVVQPSFQQPPYQCFGVGVELLSWTASVLTNSDVVTSSYFAGEAIRATVQRVWRVPGQLFPAPAGGSFFAEVINTEYRQRFYSRVDPDFVYRIGTPPQLPENNVSIAPSFRQYADPLGEPFWLLESLTITDPGQNLRIPPNTLVCNLVADGNSRHVCQNRQLTVNRSAPVVDVPAFSNWSVQPVLSVTVTPSGAGGLYVVSAVAITSGGTTTQTNGTFTTDLVLTTGHFLAENGRVRLVATIADGTLSAISIQTADSIIGPSTLATISIGFVDINSSNHRVVGESLFKTSRSHTQPTVTATRTVGGTTQTPAVTLSQATDLMGETYWYVSDLTGAPPPAGSAPLIFEVTSPGIEAKPAIAQVITPFGQPAFFRIRSGGKYFVRTTTETEEELPSISCIGELNEENGWEIQSLEELGLWNVFRVGETYGNLQEIPFQFGGGSYETTRTRRCGMPTITLELE